MIQIGIMQGRLSPPTDGKYQSFPKYNWKEEFYKAKDCDLDIIEWIFEADDWEKNPISSDKGIEAIKELNQKTGIKVISICADYFMDLPFIRVKNSEEKERLNKLNWLIKQSAKLGVRFINIPFVDNSAILIKDEMEKVAEHMRECSELARENSIELCLETSLNPNDFKILLDKINRENVNANYDIGNSASLGYDVNDEFKKYGKKIKTLHIKDRILNGGTVPLGTGNADFDLTFNLLKENKFIGPVIFQAARKENGKEVDAINNYISYMKTFLNRLR